MSDRRKWQILASLPLLGVVSAIAFTHGAFALVGLFFGILILIGIVLVVLLVDRRGNAIDAKDGQAVSAPAKFFLADLLKSPIAVHPRLRSIWIRLVTGNYVVGRAVFHKHCLAFVPGNIARKAGFEDINVPWSTLSSLICVPERLSVSHRLILVFGEGQLAMDVRTPAIVAEQLTALFGSPAADDYAKGARRWIPPMRFGA